LAHDHTFDLHDTNESVNITKLLGLVLKVTLNFLLCLIKHPHEELKYSSMHSQFRHVLDVLSPKKTVALLDIKLGARQILS
jgi:hypothetical protein